MPGPPRLARGARRGFGCAAGAAAQPCLLYTSDAADERSSVDLGGRRIIKKKTKEERQAAVDADKHTKNMTNTANDTVTAQTVC